MAGCLQAQSHLEAIIYVPDCYTRHAFPPSINDCILINDFTDGNSWANIVRVAKGHSRPEDTKVSARAGADPRDIGRDELGRNGRLHRFDVQMLQQLKSAGFKYVSVLEHVDGAPLSALSE